MNNNMELTPYVEELTWALGNDVESNEIEAELKRYLDNFDIPIAEAKRCVLKKFGGDPKQLNKVIDKTVQELSLNENSVNLLCKIIYIDEKEITVDGKNKTIVFGILGDTTGTVPFTAWHELSCDKGDVIRIYNAYSRPWNDKPQVNFGIRTHVRIMPPDALPEIKHQAEPRECSVNAYTDGLGNISTVLRILKIEKQVVNIKGESQEMFKGIVADETGKCRFSAWSDFKINKDDVVRIAGGYIRSWRGVPELRFNGGTVIEKLPQDTLPGLEILGEDKIFTVNKLKGIGGGSGIVVEGIILDIRPGSGLIKRCPECNRVLQDESCMVHGKAEGEFDLRIKGVLDDGTGALTVIIGKDCTEKILAMDLKGCIKHAKEQMRYDVIYDELIKKLLARPVRVHGDVLSDEFGLMLIGTSIESIVPKVKTEALNLIEELGININDEV